jgi:hypothetical protein
VSDEGPPPDPAPADAADDFAAMGPAFTARIDAILDDVRGEADRILDEARRKAAAGAADVDELLVDRRVRLLELSEKLIARGELLLARLEDAELARESLGRTLRALTQAADEIATEVAAGSPQDPRAI